ncbi:DNA starvation/stationary phase protection protein [Rickettsiales bacterium]|nr:DNA starvation/stationary phase protection protein [Rickettsiales bacterium]
MSKTVENLSHVLADTYTLYLKTQNYHWNVTGPQFDTLHQLFGRQHATLATAIDEIAERIRALGELAPATYKEFEQLKSMKEGTSSYSAEEMLDCLYKGHKKVIEILKNALKTAENEGDVFTVELLTTRIGAYQKDAWMLAATLSKKPASQTKAA